MSSQIIIMDEPLDVITTFNQTQINAINQLWMANLYKVAIICLVVGFAIGLFAGYHYCKGKYGDS